MAMAYNPDESTTRPMAPVPIAANDSASLADRVVPPLRSVGSLVRIATCSPKPAGMSSGPTLSWALPNVSIHSTWAITRWSSVCGERHHAGHQQVDVDLVAEVEQVDAVAQVRRRRSEHVASGERRAR